MYNGIINVYKEKGFTSHDVVAKLRGILKQKKIGHTGTLDPDATGVLPVCLGKGTKLCDMLTDKSKTYKAVMLLGLSTDTQDISGNIINKSNKSVEELREEIDDDFLKTTIMSFLGEYNQIPPMYSALKVNGKKLYELAREGITIERQARMVIIHEINILEIDFPKVTMEVSCSKGTYILTLCNDIGEKLGTYACMEDLVRTKVERFYIKDALTLSEVEEKVKTEEIDKFIIPVSKIFEDIKKVNTTKEGSRFLYNGNPIQYDEKYCSMVDLEDEELLTVYDDLDNFLGVYKYYQERRIIKPEKMFLGSDN